MKKLVILPILVILSCASGQNKSQVNDLSKAQKDLIYNSCFEVVVEKPVKDSLSYEKELPWDSIPYNVRVDKYYSIGTAFSISETELVSAFHVIDLKRASMMYPKFFIRDANGDVFELDTIESFDTHRDFIKFKVKNKKFTKWFKINANYEINEMVYSVGNAYGEGVVIRKGDLIGTIAEAESNKFKLLRSSSDVNSGNSGGPLLDKNCDVIGINLARKDNITYSLPIKEMSNVKSKTGVFHLQLKFGFCLIPDTSKMTNFDYEVSLPKKYKDIIKDYKVKFNSFYENKMDDFLKSKSAEMFPEGESSIVPLNDFSSSVLPQIMFKDKDDLKWYISNMKYESSKLRNNGAVETSRAFGRLLFADITKPDDMKLKEIANNPKAEMKLLLEGINIPRTIGNEKVRITGMGDPIKVEQYVDSYKRKWRMCLWLFEYSDDVIISYSTLTPQGVSIVMLECDTSDLEESNYDMRKILDFVHVSYYGKLKEWKEFMELKNQLPQIFSDVNFSFVENKNFNFTTKKYAFKADSDIVKIEDDTRLTVNFGFYHDAKKVIWDIRRLVLAEDNKSNAIVIFKLLKPDSRLHESYQKNWNKALAFEHPYDQEPYKEDDTTNIIGINSKYKDAKDKSNKSLNFIYTMFISKQGNVDNDKMKEQLDKVNTQLNIKE